MSYNPWLDAHRRYPDVHIAWCALAPARAAWVPSERVILVDESLSKAERRCALAHELAHIDTGDRITDLCWFGSRQETAADKLAARRLISLGDLCHAVRCYPDAREAAAELEVSLHVLKLRGRTLHPAERGAIENVLSRREAVA